MISATSAMRSTGVLPPSEPCGRRSIPAFTPQPRPGRVSRRSVAGRSGAANHFWRCDGFAVHRPRYHRVSSDGYHRFQHQEDVDDIRDTLERNNGPGNVRNVFVYAPHGKKYGVQLIPVRDGVYSASTTIATRRFCARPAAVWLSATGLRLPSPRCSMLPGARPVLTSTSDTAAARRAESASL